jgi:glycosyltransferase involved in cell wall biosynthesis
MKPTVSVVIPAYNRAGSIRMAVDSILRQTYSDFELIVVDDGSTDGTMLEVSGIADKRLRCLTLPANMGVSAARNAGIRAARGTWVAFQDSDDEWLPRKLEKQMARLSQTQNDPVGCYCGMCIVGTFPGKDRGQSPGSEMRKSIRYIPEGTLFVVEGDLRKALLRHSLASTQTLVVRRDALLQIDGFDEALPALVDWDCVIRLAELGPFAFVDEPLVLQYFSDNSITRSRQKRAAARARIIEKHHGLFSAHPEILAHHHVSIAGELRRLGDLAEARKSLGQARRFRPFDPVILAKWISVSIRSMLQAPMR